MPRILSLSTSIFQMLRKIIVRLFAITVVNYHSLIIIPVIYTS